MVLSLKIHFDGKVLSIRTKPNWAENLIWKLFHFLNFIFEFLLRLKSRANKIEDWFSYFVWSKSFIIIFFFFELSSYFIWSQNILFYCELTLTDSTTISWSSGVAIKSWFLDQIFCFYFIELFILLDQIFCFNVGGGQWGHFL